MCFTASYTEYTRCMEQIKRLQGGTLKKVDERIICVADTIKVVLEHSMDYDFFKDWCERCNEAKRIKEKLRFIEEELKDSYDGSSLWKERIKAVSYLKFIME